MNQEIKNYELEQPVNNSEQEKYEETNFSDEPSFSCKVK